MQTKTKVTLYQIIPELDTDRLMFQDLDAVQAACGGRVPAEIYESVYHGDLEVAGPEDVYYIFNMDHPDGYRGRPMSVSDVVELTPTSGCSTFYFCNPVGHVQIEFEKWYAKNGAPFFYL